jgi:hypothetical protein
MIYSMSRSRYCEHIGREHKSNYGNSSIFALLTELCPANLQMLPNNTVEPAKDVFFYSTISVNWNT